MKLKTQNFSRFNWRKLSFPLIAVDEVGRGCLAGPVVAGAVLIESSKFRFDRRITDSKKLSSALRSELALRISSSCRTGIGQATPQEIDELNILQASFLAMKRAIEALQVTSGFVLVDGNFKIPSLIGFEQHALIKGDLRAQPVGAASILAKVYRDQLMAELSQSHPGYGFEIHKGYGTKIHRQAIKELGVSVLHRRSFKGVLEGWGEDREAGLSSP